MTIPVPERTTAKAPEFGRFLRKLRGDRSLGRQAAKVRAHLKPIVMKVPPSLISKYENGRVPPWHVLGAYSRLSGIDFEKIVQELGAAVTIPGASDLIRHGLQSESDGDRELSADDNSSQLPSAARSDQNSLHSVKGDPDASSRRRSVPADPNDEVFAALNAKLAEVALAVQTSFDELRDVIAGALEKRVSEIAAAETDEQNPSAGNQTPERRTPDRKHRRQNA